jgi:hypothetical protein
MTAAIRSLERRLDSVSGENLEVSVASGSVHFDDIQSFLREKRSHTGLIKGLGI